MLFQPSDHTFVVCAYKTSPYLEECIASLLNQSVKSNVVIATSTPNDHIRGLADKYKLRLYISSGKSGIAQDWNHALSKVDTPLATIAHQDDIYLESYTEEMLSAINSSIEPLIFFSDYGEIRCGGTCDKNKLLRVKRMMLSPLKLKGAWRSKMIRRRILSLGCPICCPSVTYNLSSLERPIFNNRFKGSLDWETWERLSRRRGSFVYSSKILMRHRIHLDSETSSLILDNVRSQEDIKMLEQFWPAPIARLIFKFYRSSQSSNRM